jgi:hypothetical protein
MFVHVCEAQIHQNQAKKRKKVMSAFKSFANKTRNQYGIAKQRALEKVNKDKQTSDSKELVDASALLDDSLVNLTELNKALIRNGQNNQGSSLTPLSRVGIYFFSRVFRGNHES